MKTKRIIGLSMLLSLSLTACDLGFNDLPDLHPDNEQSSEASSSFRPSYDSSSQDSSIENPDYDKLKEFSRILNSALESEKHYRGNRSMSFELKGVDEKINYKVDGNKVPNQISMIDQAIDKVVVDYTNNLYSTNTDSYYEGDIVNNKTHNYSSSTYFKLDNNYYDYEYKNPNSGNITEELFQVSDDHFNNEEAFEYNCYDSFNKAINTRYNNFESDSVDHDLTAERLYSLIGNSFIGQLGAENLEYNYSYATIGSKYKMVYELYAPKAFYANLGGMNDLTRIDKFKVSTTIEFTESRLLSFVLNGDLISEAYYGEVKPNEEFDLHSTLYSYYKFDHSVLDNYLNNVNQREVYDRFASVGPIPEKVGKINLKVKLDEKDYDGNNKMITISDYQPNKLHENFSTGYFTAKFPQQENVFLDVVDKNNSNVYSFPTKSYDIDLTLSPRFSNDYCLVIYIDGHNEVRYEEVNTYYQPTLSISNKYHYVNGRYYDQININLYAKKVYVIEM